MIGGEPYTLGLFDTAGKIRLLVHSGTVLCAAYTVTFSVHVHAHNFVVFLCSELVSYHSRIDFNFFLCLCCVCVCV